MEENKFPSGNESEMEENQSTTVQDGGAIVEPPMKWFHFLIYLSLWMGALSNLGTGFMYITGDIYLREQVEPEVVYTVFEGLKNLDVFYGVCVMLLGVSMIIVRSKLAKFKSEAPTLFLNLYLINIVISILYILIAGKVIGELSVSQIFSTLIVNGVYYFANRVYFKKRAYLFNR